MTPEDRHRVCWYSRRTSQIPIELGLHTIMDGQLLYCAHPMLWPVVGYEFDVSNCAQSGGRRERMTSPVRSSRRM